MDNLAVKNSLVSEKSVGNASSRDNNTSLEKLANTFRQLVTTAGTTFETGLDSISHQAGISGVAKQPDSNPAADDYRDAPARDDDNGRSDRPESRDAGRSDVGARDQRDEPSSRRDDHPVADNRDTRQSGADDHRRDDSATSAPTDDVASRDQDHGGASSRSDQGKDQSAAKSDSGDTGQTAQKANAGEAGTAGETGAQTAAANAQQAALAGANAGIQVGNSLPGAAAKAETVSKGETGPVAQNAAQTGPDALNASKGPAAQGAGVNTHNGPQANGAAAGQAQAQVQAQANGEANAAAQQQAQKIAKTLNPNDKVQIKVNVSSEAETLTSKPSSTLTTGTILAAGDGKSTNQSGPQNTANQAANGQNPSVAAVAQQVQAAQNQNQNQQNASQNNQAQAQVQAATTGKTASAGSAAQASTGVHSGGAETGTGASTAANGSGSAQLTQQAQQSQQAQNANMSKEAPKGSSVTDQVSVKISKALLAGHDRISIQLKPSELGRVDVKMELAHDGRVIAVVTADNKDTLDLLRRDSSDLQKALEDAGMRLDSGDLSFNMRGEEGEMMAEDQSGSGASGTDADDVPDSEIEDIILAENTNVVSDSRIDVRA